MIIAEIALFVFLGLVFGSFSSALIYRLPEGLPWISERSMCTSCKEKLTVFDLVPVFSWLLSGGKCRHCKARISCRYPLFELLSVFLCLCIYYFHGASAEAFFITFSLPFLLSLFFIDLKHYILPNILVAILLFIGLLRVIYYSYTPPYVAYDYIASAFLYGLFSWGVGLVLTKVLKKDALGFGDVKFFVVSGLWLGSAMVANFLILSGGVGILFALIWKKTTGSDVFPFGPSLIISLFILLLFQGYIFI